MHKCYELSLGFKLRFADALRGRFGFIGINQCHDKAINTIFRSFIRIYHASVSDALASFLQPPF